MLQPFGAEEIRSEDPACPNSASSRIGDAMKRDGSVNSVLTSRLEKSVCQTINRIFQICDQLSQVVVSDLEKLPGDQYRLPDIKNLYASVQKALSAPNAPVYGVGFAANPKVFLEPGLLWWYAAPAGERLQPLNVSMQEGNLTYYDYTVSHWWRGSQGDEKPHLFGPFVDHSGTNAYVVTFSRGVFIGDKQVGLIVGDVLVGTLQALWQRELSALPKPSSLVDEEGVVVATNSARLLGGVLRKVSGSVALPVKGATWRVVVQSASTPRTRGKKAA
ncbi:cache domain-containing protein [Bradyrhizobium sp.]|uniref:cache domain-containing protein n=1 Tax=Bradyrhizobium sp. TaxID=376 RepID=UPI0039E299B4